MHYGIADIFYSGRYFLSNSSYCLPNVKQCRQNVFVEVANKCLTGKGAEKGVENFHRKHIGSRLANNPSKKSINKKCTQG